MPDLLDSIAQSTDISILMRTQGKLFALARIGRETTFDLYRVEGWQLIKRHPTGLRLLNNGEVLIRTEDGFELLNSRNESIRALDASWIAYDTSCSEAKTTVTATKEFITIHQDSETFCLPTPKEFQRLSLSPQGHKLALINIATDTNEPLQSHIHIWTLSSRTIAKVVIAGNILEAKWLGEYLFVKRDQDDYISIVAVHGETLDIQERTEQHVPLGLDAEVFGVKPTLGGTKISEIQYEWTTSSAFVDEPVIGLTTSRPGTSYIITLLENNQVVNSIVPPSHFEIAHQSECFMLETSAGTIPSLKITPLTESDRKKYAVVFHGGPHDTYQGEWNPLIAVLLAYGWTVLCPNVRGSTGFGRAYAQLQGQWGIRDFEDALACTTYASTYSQRVVAVGMSYGGYLAALVGSRLGSQVLGFVGVNGIYSPAELLTSAPPLVQAWLHREQITSQTPDAVKLVNSSTRGLLIHALNDQVAPAHQAHALAQAIARKGGKVDALWIEGEGHTIANPIHVREALESVIHFIEEAS